MDISDGRGRIVSGAILHGIAQQTLFILLEHGILMLQHGHPVNDAVHLHTRSPDVRGPADRHKRHESTVGTARVPDLIGIHVTGRFQELGRVNLILQIAAAEVLVVGLLKLHTIAGRTAHVGLDADVSPGYEGSHPRTPVIPGLPRRPAVRQDQRGVRAVAFQVEGNPQQRADRFSIEGFVADDL